MNRIKKRCKTLGCPNLHTNLSGYCDECTRKFREKHPKKEQEDRPSSNERGYDHRWRMFSQRFLRSHPVCAICGAPAKVTDHKAATAEMMMDAYGHFDLDPNNYQALCYACNNRKAKTKDKEMRKQYEADKKVFGID